MNELEFNPEKNLLVNHDSYRIYAVDSIPGLNLQKILNLPYSIRVLIENSLRAGAHGQVVSDEISRLAEWNPCVENHGTISFFPGRVILQDFTGVPVLNDLAALRTALARAGSDPLRANPVIPVDLVIDHSIQIDTAGSPGALAENTRLEYGRNQERYEFLRWSGQAFNHLRIIPPAAGIVHQINLEALASVVLTSEENGIKVAFPDTVVGTDSHTTMINGLGVLGWGIGGIEAAAAMLGEPLEIPVPDVIGVYLLGKLPEGTTPTDMTLAILQKLRKHGVVDKFIEFFGPGLDELSLADRAMVANITPETGATTLYFPIDRQTLDYLRFSGRSAEQAALVEAYCRAQHILREPGMQDPKYSDLLEVDLSEIQPAMAGPKRPQDRIPLSEVKNSFLEALAGPTSTSGFGIDPCKPIQNAEIRINGESASIGHGSVVLAAITSCTNTSNPYVMLTAGMVARNAVAKGLRVPLTVKTSLAPGSRVVTEYLRDANLLGALETLGFHVAAYGCTTCIGNSGPLDPFVTRAIIENNLVTAAVISGNRNFEGRVNPHTRANYLASPPLVVAYALAGRIDLDLTSEPLGNDQQGQPVFLRDLWPSSQEVHAAIAAHVHPKMFENVYSGLLEGTSEWKELKNPTGSLYHWSPESNYLQEPPFFFSPDELNRHARPIRSARILAWLGDSITTDHISPAGSIPVQSPAGQYLISQGVTPADFNAYGARRGNDRVMTRGTFANIRLKNRLVPGMEGGFTRHLPDGEIMTIYEASQRYKSEDTSLVVLAGKEYGTGSSRDWAAKGVLLLGVRAVLAESFERIHRSNLAGMGVLPLQFQPGESAAALGLTGEETISIDVDPNQIKPGAEISVHAEGLNGHKVSFSMVLRLDTERDVEYYRSGGILNRILMKIEK